MKIKFISLNLWNGGMLFDNIVSFLASEKPDIIALQEAYDSFSPYVERRFQTVSALRQTLAFPYEAFAPAFIDPRAKEGNIDQGNLILSKFPLSSHKITFFDIPYGEFSQEKRTDFENEPCNLQEAIATISGKNVHIFNIHGIWGKDGKDSDRRIVMSNTIVSKIQGKRYAILAGDFNVQPYTKTIYNIENHLKNVFQDELSSTFSMKHKKDPGYATAVVDMVFVGKEIQIGSHSCPVIDVSDHLPLVCELEFS